MFWIPFMIGYAVVKGLSNSNESGATQSSPPSRTEAKLPLKNQIVVIGRSSVGKSSLCNALIGYDHFGVGVEHGTTSTEQRVQLNANWHLCDMPGLLDQPKYWVISALAAKQSRVLIYVTTGQLYQKEVAFMHQLFTHDKAQHSERYSDLLRIVFINQQDIKRKSQSTSDQELEKLEIERQIPFISKERIVSGAASPVDSSQPELSSLTNLIAGSYPELCN